LMGDVELGLASKVQHLHLQCLWQLFRLDGLSLVICRDGIMCLVIAARGFLWLLFFIVRAVQLGRLSMFLLIWIGLVRDIDCMVPGVGGWSWKRWRNTAVDQAGNGC